MKGFGQETSRCSGFSLRAAIVSCLIVMGANAVAADKGRNDLDRIYVVGPRLPTFPGGSIGFFGSFDTGTIDHGNYGDYVADLPDTDTSERSASTESGCEGNPVVLATGNKVEFETDFESFARDGLSLHRTYNHYLSENGIFGKNWSSNHDYQIKFFDHDAGACTVDAIGIRNCDKTRAATVEAVRPDGRRLRYARDNAGIYRSVDAGSSTYMQWDQQNKLVYYAENNEIETYGRDALGLYSYISLRKNAYGETLTYQGVWWKTDRITHSSGRYIELFWDSNWHLTAIRDPNGNFHGYGYRNVEGKDLILAAHTQSDTSTSVTYHYENPVFQNALTGKSYNGVRYSTFVFNQDGRVASTEHAGGVEKYLFDYGRSTITVCDDSGCHEEPAPETYTTVSNPLGKTATYVYEGGREKAVLGDAATFCPATATATTYDANNFVDKKIDANENVVDFDYDAKGRLIKRVDAFGTPNAKTTNYVWDVNRDRLLQTTVVGQYSQEFTFATDGRIENETVRNLSSHGLSQSTRTTTYAYTKHPNGLLSSMVVDGPLSGSGDALTYAFNPTGDLISLKNSLGHETVFSGYNGRGQSGRSVGANGETVDFSYDAIGRPILQRNWVGSNAADTVLTYHPHGGLASLTTPDGMVTNHVYDAAQRLTRVWRAVAGVLVGGATQEEQIYTYDAMSNITNVKNRKLVGTTWSTSASSFTDYDELGRVRAQRGNNGQNMRYTYDANGNLKTIKDSANRVTTLAYDALDRVQSSTDPLSPAGVTRYEYDAGDRVTKVTDPRNLVTTYVYDGFGQVWAQYSPDTGTTTTQYNAGGQPTLLTRNDGSVLGYTYDALGRLNSVGASATSARNFSYDWCTAGKSRLCGVSTNDSTQMLTSTIYAYTPQGQVDHKRDVASVGGTHDWTAYTYDGMGRLTGVGYPSGVGAGYGYAGGKLQLMTATIGGVAQTVVSNMRYLPFGPAVSWDTGNGLTRNLYYDQNLSAGALRLTGLTTMDGGATLQSQLLAYDTDSRITSITNFMNPGHSQAYGYDALSRLTAVTSPAGNETLQYDANGNRTMHNWLAAIANEVDPASNRILRDYIVWNDGINYTYDGRGNRATQYWNGSTATYGYDGYNRLASVSRNAPSTYHNGGYASMTYPSATTVYSTNALDQRVTKFNMTLSARYVYSGQNTLLAENNNGQWTSHLWLGEQPIGLVRGNTLYWTHTDHLTRPEMVTNAAKQVVWKAKNLHSERAVIVDNIGGYNLGLPGQYSDAESGLWYNGFRYYDSRLGSYTQSDPIGLNGGTNTYAYVGGNPVSYVDSLGLSKDIWVSPIQNDGDWTIYWGARADPDRQGIHTIYAHGSSDSMTAASFLGSSVEVLNSAQAATRIRNSNWNGKDPVWLKSCDTGASPNGFAQQLANYLGVTVYAPNRLVWFNTSGVIGPAGYTEGDPDYSDPGQYAPFYPMPPVGP